MPSAIRPLPFPLLALCVLLAGGCAVHWPHRHPPRPEAPVQALNIAGEGGPVTIGQSWHRNALQLDLTGLAGAGSAQIGRAEHLGWPVRLELRVQPGALRSVELAGSAHVRYAIAASGGAYVISVDPDVYRNSVATLTLRWSAADDLAR